MHRDDWYPRYPRGTVRALLDTAHVTPATRAALRARLDGDGRAASGCDAAPRFLDAPALATLRAACARLVSQPDGAPPIDLVAMVDARLAAGAGNGWRYAALPPDGDAYRVGARGLDESARAAYGVAFAALTAAHQDALLHAVQSGAVRGGAWDTVPPARWFEELLAELVECYYSHPLAQEEIGYVGMADVPGWPALGLDVLDAREPRPLGTDDRLVDGRPVAGTTHA